jgi:hypothetical protein
MTVPSLLSFHGCSDGHPVMSGLSIHDFSAIAVLSGHCYGPCHGCSVTVVLSQLSVHGRLLAELQIQICDAAHICKINQITAVKYYQYTQITTWREFTYNVRLRETKLQKISPTPCQSENSPQKNMNTVKCWTRGASDEIINHYRILSWTWPLCPKKRQNLVRLSLTSAKLRKNILKGLSHEIETS